MSEKICAICILFICCHRFAYAILHHGMTEAKTWNAYYELLNFIITLSLFYTAGLFDSFKL